MLFHVKSCGCLHNATLIVSMLLMLGFVFYEPISLLISLTYVVSFPMQTLWAIWSFSILVATNIG